MYQINIAWVQEEYIPKEEKTQVTSILINNYIEEN